jgi:hypothetical protein
MINDVSTSSSSLVNKDSISSLATDQQEVSSINKTSDDTGSSIVKLSSGVKETPLTYTKQSLLAEQGVIQDELPHAVEEATTNSFGGTKKPPPT